MQIILTSGEYASLKSTKAAHKALLLCCRPGDGMDIILSMRERDAAILTSRGGDLKAEALAATWAFDLSGNLFPKLAKVAPHAPPAPAKMTKGSQVVALLQRPDGATNAEIMEATGWKTHTVRGFLAGAMLKALGLKAVRFDHDRGPAYRLAPIEGDKA